MTNRRNYPTKLQSHKHHAFELVGMTYEDYKLYCKKVKIPSTSIDSKKNFFKAVSDEELIKKDNMLYLKGEKI